MKIQFCNRITDSLLFAHPSEVLMMRSVEISNGMNPAPVVVAGILLPHGDGPGMARIMSVRYHAGLKGWVFAIEHSIQQATSYARVTLPQALEMFERGVQAELPEVKILDCGVGIYTSKDSTVTENPFAILDGCVYEVRSKDRGVRRFRARFQDGLALVAFASGFGGEEDGDFDLVEPRFALSIEEWKSLRLVAECRDDAGASQVVLE